MSDKKNKPERKYTNELLEGITKLKERDFSEATSEQHVLELIYMCLLRVEKQLSIITEVDLQE